jgi:hypothetical protein
MHGSGSDEANRIHLRMRQAESRFLLAYQSQKPESIRLAGFEKAL